MNKKKKKIQREKQKKTLQLRERKYHAKSLILTHPTKDTKREQLKRRKKAKKNLKKI